MLTEFVKEIILSFNIGVKNDDKCVLAISFAQLLAPVCKSSDKHIDHFDHDRCYRPFRNFFICGLRGISNGILERGSRAEGVNPVASRVMRSSRRGESSCTSLRKNRLIITTWKEGCTCLPNQVHSEFPSHDLSRRFWKMPDISSLSLRDTTDLMHLEQIIYPLSQSRLILLFILFSTPVCVWYL